MQTACCNVCTLYCASMQHTSPRVQDMRFQSQTTRLTPPLHHQPKSGVEASKKMRERNKAHLLRLYFSISNMTSGY